MVPDVVVWGRLVLGKGPYQGPTLEPGLGLDPMAKPDGRAELSSF